MACKMCNSKKHSTKTHKARAALGRLKSKKWRTSVTTAHSSRMRKWWPDPKNRARMTKKRRVQGKRGSKAFSAAMKRRWQDPVYHAKMCKIRKTQSKGNQARTPNASQYRARYSGPNGRFWMRSRWEVALATCLDALGVEWQYEPQTFALGNGRHYTPDFYIPKRDLYIEVKGWLNKRQAKNIALLRKQRPELRLLVMFQNDLKAAGVLGEVKPRKLAKVLQFPRKVA